MHRCLQVPKLACEIAERTTLQVPKLMFPVSCACTEPHLDLASVAHFLGTGRPLGQNPYYEVAVEMHALTSLEVYPGVDLLSFFHGDVWGHLQRRAKRMHNLLVCHIPCLAIQPG